MSDIVSEITIPFSKNNVYYATGHDSGSGCKLVPTFGLWTRLEVGGLWYRPGEVWSIDDHVSVRTMAHDAVSEPEYWADDGGSKIGPALGHTVVTGTASTKPRCYVVVGRGDRCGQPVILLSQLRLPSRRRAMCTGPGEAGESTVSNEIKFRAHDRLTDWEGPVRDTRWEAELDRTSHVDSIGRQGGISDAIVVCPDEDGYATICYSWDEIELCGVPRWGDGDVVWPSHGRSCGAVKF